jgi:hypothetical protein
MWIQSVFNAISEVEYSRPGLANRVAAFDPDSEWTESEWRDYGFVAGAIVEPFTFPGGESSDEEWYYEMTETNGFGQVKANITDVENSEAWQRICDLVEIMGY